MKASSQLPLLPFLLGGLLAVASAQTANPYSREVRDRTEQASREAVPLKDDGDGKVSPRAVPERDTSKLANPESRETDDRLPQRASPDAGRTADGTTDKANPESAKVRDSVVEKAGPRSDHTAVADRAREAQPTADELAVRQTYDEAAESLKSDTLRIENAAQARKVIDQVLGAESDISVAEERRTEVLPGAVRVSGADLHAAGEMIGSAFAGELMPETVPASVQSWMTITDVKEPGAPDPGEMRREFSYASRADVPPVLLAAGVLDQVRIDSAEDVWVLSYLMEGAMVTSDIFDFTPDSTRLGSVAPHDLLRALSVAMQGEKLKDARFAIECHSAGGDEAQALAQHRAEAIARALVRAGVDADRLIPIGSASGTAPVSAEGGEDRSQIQIVRLATKK